MAETLVDIYNDYVADPTKDQGAYIRRIQSIPDEDVPTISYDQDGVVLDGGLDANTTVDVVALAGQRKDNQETLYQFLTIVATARPVKPQFDPNLY